MSGSEPQLDLLRRTLRELAQADAAELLDEARERARIRALELIEDALLDELVQAVAGVDPAGSQNAQTQTRSGYAPTELRASAGIEPSASLSIQRPSEEPLWWAYCVVPAHAVAGIPPALAAIEPGTAIEIVREGELSALVSPVPADEYDDVHLREHLEDLGWLERTARRHEAVLEAVLDQVPLVPLRLCTLYHDLLGIRRLLAEHAQALVESLNRVDGCAEWGVKVFAGTAAPEVAVETGEDDPVAGGPGAAYLVNRRRERDRAERVSELHARCVEDVHQRVLGCARESATNPPQSRELHGRDMTMLLNGVYLVANERVAELHDAVDALGREWEPAGFALELTGPWPAYNFVSGAIGVMP